MGAHYLLNEQTNLTFGLGIDSSSRGEVYYPYLGYEWRPTPQWAVELLIPWPSVIYAPSKDYFFQFGAIPVGSQWAISDNSNDLSVVYSRWGLGIAGEYRLSGHLWLQTMAGYTGLGGVELYSDGDMVVDSRLDSSPYFRFALNFRP